MGYSTSWLACRGISEAEALHRLNLKLTDRMDDFSNSPLAGQSMADGWYMVVASRCDHPIAGHDVLRNLSLGAEVVACSIEEHVMFSAAEYWCNGQKRWRLEHSAEKGLSHLEVSGIPGKGLSEQMAAAKAQLSKRPGVDYFFDIPLNFAREVCGFKHDEENPAVPFDGYRVLEELTTQAGAVVSGGAESRASSNRKPWWQLW